MKQKKTGPVKIPSREGEIRPVKRRTSHSQTSELQLAYHPALYTTGGRLPYRRIIE